MADIHNNLIFARSLCFFRSYVMSFTNREKRLKQLSDFKTYLRRIQEREEQVLTFYNLKPPQQKQLKNGEVKNRCRHNNLSGNAIFSKVSNRNFLRLLFHVEQMQRTSYRKRHTQYFKWKTRKFNLDYKSHSKSVKSSDKNI